MIKGCQAINRVFNLFLLLIIIAMLIGLLRQIRIIWRRILTLYVLIVDKLNINQVICWDIKLASYLHIRLIEILIMLYRPSIILPNYEYSSRYTSTYTINCSTRNIIRSGIQWKIVVLFMLSFLNSFNISF